MPRDIRVRVARPGDAAALLNIYAPYVTDTAITFEYDVPSPEEFRRRICATLEKYPYLVAERDGEPLGYAYLGPFKARAAYAWSAETSIYLRQDARGQGVGRILYAALEAAALVQGIFNLNACVAYPEREDARLSRDSAKFHARLGYTTVGEFHRCAYKFDAWYNMIWMEKLLGAHPERPAPIIPFPALGAEALRAAGIEKQG